MRCAFDRYRKRARNHHKQTERPIRCVPVVYELTGMLVMVKFESAAHIVYFGGYGCYWQYSAFLGQSK